MPRAEMNVTPLIDILLVLLIIFMVITPVSPASFKAKIPAEPKNTKGVEPHPDTLIVSIGNDLSLSLNTEALNASANDTGGLVKRLAEVFRLRDENGKSVDGVVDGHRERTVFISAPRQVSYGDVVRVLDAVKLSGAEPISFQIDQQRY
ncbi:MAG TPA: biopolymer transporter ExbD [Pyrinomonadaceae bacterium]|nr:biopolymer transporter ExbD [Pyrinomonadaceae bacterium]HMP66062.1 biopolymer transporter ExbD [Pyrinomonadaceae bacterium]